MCLYVYLGISPWCQKELNHTTDMSLRECGAQRHSAKAWILGHGKYGPSSDLPALPKALRKYLTFSFLHKYILNLDFKCYATIKGIHK